MTTFVKSMIKSILLLLSVFVFISTLSDNSFDDNEDNADSEELYVINLISTVLFTIKFIIKKLRIIDIINQSLMFVYLIILKFYDILFILLSPISLPLNVIGQSINKLFFLNSTFISLTWLPVYKLTISTIFIGILIGLFGRSLFRR